MSTKLRKLLELVEDRSDNWRGLLFRHVCDLFFHGPLPDAQADQDALLDVLRIMRPRVDLSVRRELAGHLYSMERPPEPLLRLLIEDEPAVANIILDYAQLPIPLLQELAEGSDPHIMARLLARPDISVQFRAFLPAGPTGPTGPTGYDDDDDDDDNNNDSNSKPAGPTPSLQPDLMQFREIVGQAYARQDQLADFSRVSSDWRFETDRDGRIIYLSDGAAHALGLSTPLSSLSGQKLPDLFFGANELAARLQSWRPFDGLKLAGKRNWVLSAVPTFDLGNGRFTGYRGMATLANDLPATVTALRPKKIPTPAAPAFLAQPLQDSLVEGITEALQTLSHEIRTPLNAIIGFSELIELEPAGPVNDDYRDCLRKIQAAGHHLNEFISEVLEDARLKQNGETSTMRATVAAGLIRTAIESVARHANVRRISVTSAPCSHDIILVTDALIAGRCLQRLIRNAMADVADGTLLAIETRQLAGGAIEIFIPLTTTAVGSQQTDAVTANALKSLRLDQIRKLGTEINATILATGNGYSLRFPAAEQRTPTAGVLHQSNS